MTELKDTVQDLPANDLPAADGMRFERKFCVDDMHARHVESLVRLHPQMFVSEYPDRWVNSLYLDSPVRDLFHLSSTGVSPRTMVRIRWYGPLLGPVISPFVEFKLKCNELGSKARFALAPFTFHDGFCRQQLASVLGDSELPGGVMNSLRLLEPVVVVRYHRKYWITAQRDFRLTLDEEIQFVRPNRVCHPITAFSVDANETVLEIKYPQEHDNAIDEVVAQFPFSLSRNSKYGQGVLATHN